MAHPPHSCTPWEPSSGGLEKSPSWGSDAAEEGGWVHGGGEQGDNEAQLGGGRDSRTLANCEV